MYIKRHLEGTIERIAARKGLVVLTGARQVGKTTMLRNQLEQVGFISLDNPLVRESATSDTVSFFAFNPPPIIVDEIQKAPVLFEYIKEQVDQSEQKGRFFLTGSQSLRLMNGISDSLAGRAGIVKMMGLSLREILGSEQTQPFLPTREQAQLGHATKLTALEIAQIIHKGSFPELYQSPSTLADWSDFFTSYFQTYIERDIRDMLSIVDESAFVKFVKAVAAQTGQILSLKTLCEVTGKDVKTINKWLSALESSGIIFMLEPYHSNINSRLTKTPKLYMCDSGLACWLLGWNTPHQLFEGAMWGHMVETFAVMEIVKSYLNFGISMPPVYFYRDKDGNEIDVVIAQNGKLYPVEIKATSAPNIGMARAFGRLGAERCQGAIICLANMPLPMENEITILPIFLI